MNVSTRTSTQATLTNCQTGFISNSKTTLLGRPSPFMRWFFILMMFVSVGVNAQTISATTYPMTTASGTALTDMSTGTTQLVAPNVDDDASAVYDIGFDFWFLGTRYTQFSVNANGLMRLGGTVVSTAFSNGLATTTNAPGIAPYWDDLWTGTNGKVHFKAIGTFPNRKLVVEWLNEQIPRSGTGASGAGTFQCWLSETSGKIDFVYGSGIITNAANSGYSVGFFTSATSYATVTTSTGGVAYNTAANNTQTDAITAGTQYTFTPITSMAAVSNLAFSGVTLTGMTLTWSAASPTTNIIRYAVYNSTDGGTTFNYVGQTNVGTNSLVVTGLAASTNYIWRVYSVSEGALGNFYEDSQSTNACSIAAGTYSVGPAAANYTTITAAVAALSTSGILGSIILELQSGYVSSAEPAFPVVLSNIACASSSFTITIRPAAGATGRSITSTNTTATLSIDGGTYYRIDGRPGGVGSADLAIGNTSTGAAIRFINDASNNIVRYATVSSGATSTTSGVIVFSTTTGANGNDNNTIDNCDLNGGGVVGNVIYASGSTTTLATYNNGNIISNNKIHDQFLAGSATNGISIVGGNSDWTITGNSFYQSATRTYTTAATHTGINISSSTAGNAFVITNNFIGGGAVNAGGTAWTIAGTIANRFVGIQLSVAATTASSVQGNTIANFVMASSSGATTLPGIWGGIYLSTGIANIGSTTGNTIGSGTGTGSIVVTSSTTGGVSMGIGTASSSTGNINISNNKIGSFSVAGTTTLSQSFTGIWNSTANTGSLTISANTIGSTSTANSIQYTNAGTGTTAAVLTGILQSGAGSLGVYITGNTLANFNNTYVPAVANSSTHIRGIWATTGRDSIAGNTVRDMTVAANASGTGSSASVIGIGSTSSTSGNSYIRANTIYSLSNTNASAASYVTGIYWNGPSTGGMIDRNLVYSLYSPSSSALVNGINAAGATTTYQNNMIRLGIDATGASRTTATNFNGFLETAGTNNIWHNTVYIGGTGVNATPAINTYAFYNNATITTTRSIRDNIFMNERSASSGASKHYAIRIGGTTVNPTGLTINNNFYVANGATTGVLGFYNSADVSSLGAWQAAVGGDVNSYVTYPCMVNPTAGTPNLHLTDCAGAGNPADGVGFNVGVVDDYDLDVRASFTPTDIGADAGNYGVVGVDVGLSALVTPGPATGCYTSTETVTVALKNYGLTTHDFSVNPATVTVNATGPTGAYTSNVTVSTGTLAANGTQNVVMPVTYDMTLRGTYAFTGSATVTGDVNTVNDILPPSNRVYNTLGGSYNVGTGGDFITLTAAIAAYNAATCLNGAVTFLLTNTAIYNTANGETFPLTITNQANASAVNTLTIKPAPSTTVSITNSTASNQLIKIINNKYVTIDGSNNGTTSRDLTISNTSTTSPNVILIGSTGTTAITNVTVKNCILSNGINTSTAVIVSDGTAAGTAGYFNNITIQNNSIRKAYMGVYGIAAVLAGNGSGYTLNGNNLDATGTDAIRYVGLYLQGIDGATVSNNQIGNFDNVTSEVKRGIWLATEVKNTTVSGNNIYNLNVAGTGTSNPVGINLTSTIINANNSITGNTISGLTGVGTGTTTGIALTGSTGGFTINRNKISDIKNTSATTGGAVAIALSSTSTAAGTLVKNNFIYDVSGNGGANNGNGIAVVTGAGYNIYNNSINLNTPQATASTVGTAPITVAATVVDAGAINLVNNILANTRASGALRYSIYSSAPASVFGTINNNDYYTLGSNLGYIGSNRTTLADIVTGFGGNANSKSVAPVFISPTDLHLNTILNINLNAAGAPLAAVTTDIDGDTRNATTPDIGADEFDPAPGLNVGLSALIAPGTNGCFSATEAVTVQLTNYSIDPIDFSVDNVTVSVTATGGAGYSSSVVLTTGTLASGASTNVTLPATIDMTTFGAYTFNGTATVVGDIYTANDAMPQAVRTSVAPTVGTVSITSPNPASYCLIGGRPVLQLSAAAGGIIQWQESTTSASGPWTNVGTDSLRYTVATNITATSYYQATVTCGATTVTSNAVTVTFNNPSVTGTTPGTRCGVGTVPLAATGSAGSTLSWFAAASGGAALATGTTFNTPSINATTTYYVSAAVGAGLNETAGRTTQTATSGFLTTPNWGVVFDATQSFTLVSTTIYPVGSGTVTVALLNSSDVELASTAAISVTGSGQSTPVVVPLSFSVTPGTGYRLVLKNYTGITDLIRESGIGGFPYASPSGALSVTGGWTGTASSTSYYWFYSLALSSGCSSARTAVTATVTTPPALSITPSGATTFCLNGSVTLNGTSAGYTNYAWTANPSGTAGIGSPASASTLVTPSAAGTYIYTLTANDGTGPSGCANTATVSVTANPLPAPVTISPNTTICVGGNATLTANSGSTAPGPVANYGFATSTGASLDPMTGAIQLLASGDDDTPTASSTAIGFTFNFNGTNFTDFSVSPDGWILLGTATASSQFSNSVTSTTNIPKIYPYWDDLATGTDGNVTYLVTGSSPNRILKVQWQVTIPRATAGASNSTFQAWLYEGSNKIEFRYGTLGSGSMSASVGLTGDATNYQSVTVTSNTVSNSVPDNAVADQPASGRMYSFTQPSTATAITWSPATYLNTTSGNTVVSTPTGLTAGQSITYTATATLGACPVSNTVTVTMNNVAVSAIAADALCNGGTGTITATGTGGTTPYQFSLNGTTWQSSNIFSSVTTGTYTIYARDAIACSVTGNSVVVGQPATAVSASLTGSTDPTCNNGINGTATVSATGGTPGYTYDLDAGAQTNGTGSFSGLASGSHTVLVTDNNGCTTTVNFNLNNPALPSVTATNNGPVCAGSNATLTATAGFSTYAWSGPGTINNNNQQVATAVTPTDGDIFTVLVTDANGCTNTATTTVTVSANLPVSVTITVDPGNEVCAETPVTFTANPVNGGATPAYQWYLNGVAQTGETNSTYVNNGLNDGDQVYVIMTSSLACTTGSPATSNTETITITGLIFASVTMNATATTVCSGTSVTFTAVPVGQGAAPTYEFYVNNALVQNGALDTYSYVPANGDQVYVIMNSSFSCAIGSPATSDVTTMTVNATPAAPVISASASTTFCDGGSVVLSSSYTGAGNVWTPGGATTDQITVTTGGSYTVVYTSGAGCPSPASAPEVVTVNANPVATITGTASYCSGGSTTLSAATSTAGSGTITGYQWVLNGTTNLGTDVTQVVNTVGSYTVIVTNSNGCSTTSAATGVTVSASPTAVATTDCSVLTAGQSATLNGSTSTAGSGTITGYQWVLNGVTNLGTAVTQAANAAGSYTVIVTNSNGCSATSAPVVINALSGALAGGTSYAIPSNCGGFLTIAAAAAYLNTNGVTGTGAITFNVANGHTETAIAGGIVLGSTLLNASITAATPIVFQKAGVSTNPLVTASAAHTAGSITDAVIKLVGVDYVTFDGISVQENAANTVTTVATNTKTEFGYGLFYNSLTDGAQNNTIKNCAVTLTRTYANSFGIYSTVRHSSTNGLTTADITDATTGPNSNNKFYTNAISNVNVGIALVGSATPAQMDNGNDVGGASAGTGNTITNWGGLTPASAYVTVSTSNHGIFSINQLNDNISYNSITSATVTGTSVVMRGILKNYSAVPTGITTTTNINSNTITINSGFTSGALECISNQGMSTAVPTATTNINNNNLVNTVISGTATSTAFLGIANLSLPGVLNINGNTIRGVTSTATTGGFTGISTSGAVVTSLNIDNNKIGDATAGAVTFSAATSGAVTGIANTGAATTATVSITGNDFRGIVHNVAGTSSHSYIANTGITQAVTIANNTFTNLNVNTTGTTTFISTTFTGTATCVKNITGNSIVTGFNRGGASGSVILTTDNGSTLAGAVTTVQNNNFSNITVAGSTTITGLNYTDGGTSPTKNITGNTLSGWTGITGTINAVNVTYLSGVSSISNNTITNITNQGTITGITIGSSANNATSVAIGTNTISNLTSTGTGGTVTGLTCSNTSTGIAITNNNINTLSSTGVSSSVVGLAVSGSSSTATASGNIIAGLTASGTTSPTVTGMSVSSASTVTLTGNTISGLSNAGATSPLARGILVSGGTTVNVSKNKIYNVLASGASTASGITSGIAVSSGTTVNVFNNLVGDLKATAANSADAVRGINLTSTSSSSNLNISFNTIYLSATSSGTNFGTSGIFHTTSTTATTATLNMINNIIDNGSTKNGTGLTVAYRRSTTTLTNYGSSSNNNLVYAGAISASNLLYYDGTNSDQTLVAYKARLSTRDQQSVAEDASTKFLSTTGSDAAFLHIDPSIATAIESGAITISGITDDYDGDTRNATTPDIGADEINGTPLPCTGAIGGTASSVAFVCSVNTTATISVTGASTGGGITYQWQVSSTGGGVGFADVTGGSGAATLAYTTATGLAVGTYYYRLVVTCSADAGNPAYSTEKTIVVRQTPTASASSNSPLCSGTNLALIGTTDATGPLASFAWSGPNGYTSTQQSPTPFAAPINGSGTYTFTATLNGCPSTPATTVISITETPSLMTVTPSAGSFCAGIVQQLVATGGSLVGNAPVTLFSENFNGASNGWTKINNTTGGTPAAADWTLRPDGYVYSSYGTWHSNDNSQFYMSNLDAVGSGITSGSTILQSPSFSTSGVGVASVNFYQYFYEPSSGSSTGTVDASTDGSTWTTLQTYNATSGLVGAFSAQSVALTAPFLNQSTVYLRFKYDGGWRYFWGIDNVSVSYPASAPITWSPSTDLYLDALATTPYAGEVTNTVYTKPTASRLYTATATNGTCSSAATATITVNPKPAGTSVTGDATVCQGATSPVITFTASVGTAPYTFTYNINGVGTFTAISPSGANPQSASVSVPTGAAGTFAYNLVSVADIYCSNTGVSGTATVTVNPLPTVSFTGLPANMCVDAAAVTLTSNQSSGTFTGTGITDNGNGTASFNPATAGAGGPYSITFTYSNGTCSASVSQNVTVNPLPTVSFTGLPASICINAAAVTLTSNQSSGTFTGTGITDNGNGTATFNPATAGVGGPYAITFTYSNGTCSASVSQNVTVNPLPTVSFTGLAATYCTTDAAVTLTGSPAGGTFSGPGISGNTFNPATAGAGGPYTITYSYTDGNGCSNTSTQQVSVTVCASFATVNVKLFLQGYYQNVGSPTPMDNFGNGGCLYVNGLSANLNDADDVTVSLMSTVDGSLVESQTGIMQTNGTLSVQFAGSRVGNTYWLRITHRNSMETWSGAAVTLAATTPYDFSTAATQAYGSNMIEVETGVWALYSGDIIDADTNTPGVQDGVIESSDYSQMENDVYQTLVGYVPSDITGDGVVESTDYSIMENNVYQVILVARPF